jgi:hypothetical protein
MTVAEQILQAIRAWLMAVTALTDAQVIPSDDKGPRPALPYVTVKVLAADIPIGRDAKRSIEVVVVTVTGGAEGTEYELEVNGETISHTRTADDTDATVATELAELADEIDGVEAWAAGATVRLWAETLTVAETDPNLTAETAAAEWVRGYRRATVSIQAFGDQAASWVEDAILALSTDAIQLELETLGVTIEAEGSTDLSGLVDTSIEARVVRELDVTYDLRSTPVLVDEVATVATHLTFDRSEGDPDALEADVDVAL